MLLVKSKELKNLSKNSLRTVCYTLFLSFCYIDIVNAQSDTNTQSLSNPSSILSIFLSLLFVVAIIFALAWLMRRFNVTQAGNGQMRTVASLVAGTKEKVIVIEVGEKQYLLGVTSQQINLIDTLDTPLNVPQKTSGFANQGSKGFQQKLVEAMADSLNPNNKTKSAAQTKPQRNVD